MSRVGSPWNKMLYISGLLYNKIMRVLACLLKLCALELLLPCVLLVCLCKYASAMSD